MAINIFKEAKKRADLKAVAPVAEGKKKNEVASVEITKEDDPDFSVKLDKWAKKKVEHTNATTQLALLAEAVRVTLLNKWVSLFKTSGGRIPSFKVTAGGNSMTFVSADAYKEVKAERASFLQEKYGDEIITKTDKYTINDDMLKKYNVVLSKLILNSPDIEQEDKTKIIECTTKYAIAEGTINMVDELAVGAAITIDEVLADIGPTFQLKS